MKKLNLSIILFTLFFSLVANANSSFRLENGKLLTIGKSKSEIIMLAGSPISADVEKVAIDKGQDGDSVKREVLTYKLKGSIGGFYLVVVTIENNKVVSITSKQYERF
ncbi:Protein of unknown function (DUF2845) [Shewanella psychrophila]|uniref:DUF2845 domain-containing protein n=1 Tax=Shewanella psychrophila TaxID=225848 RepID=A0A1S6HSY4_9GAMM|nr:DUF2845 domain-containing protein [Shewanella psychrophila]AQS38625.1 Protein of unknown function (DUF2845) [Shewanella psychrophila]